MTGLAALLFTSTTGAKICCTPSARASFAVSSPCRRARSGLPVAPTAMFHGRFTVSSKRIPAPASRSAEMSRGRRACCCMRLTRCTDS